MASVTEPRETAPLDVDAAEAMWEAYAAARPELARTGPEHTVERFGDSAGLADELLRLVTHGPKRATAELVEAFVSEGDPLPRVGAHWIACDGDGVPWVVLRSTELRVTTFDQVDAAFAWDEGEDDRTLESWRREHSRYWRRTCAARGREWSETDEILLERFTVVWPPELADA